MLLPFFEWCEASWLGDAIRQSLWLFPVIEAVHLLGLCVLGGSLLLLDLRLLGVGLAQSADRAARARASGRGSSARIVRDARPGLRSSLSEAIKCYYNTSFWVKITTLPFALAVHVHDPRLRPLATAATTPPAARGWSRSCRSPLVHRRRRRTVDRVFIGS